MRALAKVTAGFFLIIGFFLVFLGFVLIVGGLVGSDQVTSPMQFDFGGLLKMVNLVLGSATLFQGMLLAAIGEGLWLLADLAGHNEELVRQMYYRQSAAMRPSRATPPPYRQGSQFG